MKMLKISFVLLVLSTTIISCGGKKTDGATTTETTKKKTPDQEKSEKIVGVYFTDDKEEDGATMKDATCEYFKDGIFTGKATVETFNDMMMEFVEIKMEVSGTWKIENGFLKMITEKVKTDPEISKEEKKEMIADLNKTNSAEKIIELNDQKLITEDADGERTTWKRRVQ